MKNASVKAASQCDFNLKILKEIKGVPMETKVVAKYRSNDPNPMKHTELIFICNTSWDCSLCFS